jgi:hypothetical protein
MASKKHTTNPLRFRVERIGDRFVIFDAQTWTYTQCQPGTSGSQADQECAARNGTGRQKTSESPVHQQFRDKFRGPGVTSEDLAEYSGLRPREQRPPGLDTLTPKARQLLDNAKTWLPPMLRAWANEVATQCGYGGARRRTWHTYLVAKAIRKEATTFTFTDSAIEGLHYDVWPTPPDSWECRGDIEIEQRTALVVHYLSPDPDRIKAAYFGVSERTYQRLLDSARQMLALHYVGGGGVGLVGENDGCWVDWLVEDDDSPSEDDDHWGLDAADRANLNWPK